MGQIHLDCSFPEGTILEITFLKSGNFRDFTMNSVSYTIVAEDYVENLVGVDSDGKVYFLDTAENIEMYAAKNLPTFVNHWRFTAIGIVILSVPLKKS